MSIISPSTSTQKYIPSSLEKKRIVLAYALLGIIVYFARKDQSPYELYHVRRATGWWIIFLVLLFVLIVPSLIIPMFWVILFLIYVPLVWFWFYSLREAWSGSYREETSVSPLAFLYGLGSWFFDVFEIESNTEKAPWSTTSSVVSEDLSSTSQLWENISTTPIELEKKPQEDSMESVQQ